MTAGPSGTLFDGLSAQARPATLAVQGDELCADTGDGAPLRWPLRQVHWPERTRHGQRVLELPGGARWHAASAAEFDAWSAALGRRDGWVVRLQRSWRATLAAVAAVLLLTAAGLHWGVPAAAQALVAMLPASVDEAVGDRVLQTLEQEWFKPSRIAPERQAAARQALQQAVEALPADARGHRPWRLIFRQGSQSLGPNALALPGGTLVVTDALVELLADQPDALLGVLGHEWGHVQHRHGMQGVARAALAGAALSALTGDMGTLLAAAPAVLLQMSYSREFERQADEAAAAVLRAAGRSPAAMVAFFDKLGAIERPEAPPFLSTHPPDEERRRFFEQAARR